MAPRFSSASRGRVWRSSPDALSWLWCASKVLLYAFLQMVRSGSEANRYLSPPWIPVPSTLKQPKTAGGVVYGGRFAVEGNGRLGRPGTLQSKVLWFPDQMRSNSKTAAVAKCTCNLSSAVPGSPLFSGRQLGGAVAARQPVQRPEGLR